MIQIQRCRAATTAATLRRGSGGGRFANVVGAVDQSGFEEPGAE